MRGSRLSGLLLLLAALGSAVPGHAATLKPAAEPGQMIMDYWPANGWLVQQFDRFVEVRFPGIDDDVSIGPDVLDHLDGAASEIETEVRDGDTILRVTLSCACTIAVAGLDQKTVKIDIIRPQRWSQKGVDGPAPVNAPMPKKRIDASTEKQKDEVLDVEAARARLMEQLLRAADAGIVKLDKKAETPDAPLPKEGDAVAPEADTARPDEPEGKAETEDPAIVEETVKAVTSAVRGKMPMEAEAPDPEISCLSRDLLEFQDVRGAVAFSKRLGALRRSLLGEFDQPDPKTSIELSKFYIAVKAREEASLIAKSEVNDPIISAVLVDIADLVDGRAVGPNSHLLVPDCGPQQALWRAFALATTGDDAGAIRAADRSERALEHMPAALREVISARLGMAATRIGAWRKAKHFDAMAQRSANVAIGRSADALILSAEMKLWDDDHEAARDLLRTARERDGELGKRALVRLGEVALASGKLADLDTSWLRKDLGILAYQERGRDLGQKAFELEVKLLDRAGEREQAISLLNYGVTRGLYAPDQHSTLLAEIASGEAFSSLIRPLGLSYLDDPESYGAALEQDAFRTALVRSLADEGLPAVGSNLMEGSDRKTLLSIAKAQLSANDPNAALATLSALPPDAQSDLLAAQAHLDAGHLEQAQSLAADLQPGDLPKDMHADLAQLRVNAATAVGQLETALQAYDLLLQVEPDPQNARNAALLALRLGNDAMPDAAARILKTSDPQSHARIEGLFDAPEFADAADPKAYDGLLEQLDQELTLIQELMKDG